MNASITQRLSGAWEFRLAADGVVSLWQNGVCIREFTPREWAMIVKAMCPSGDGDEWESE